MTENISEKEVHQAVGRVMHPAISRTLVELGMVKDINLENGKVTLMLVLPILGIPASIKDFLVNSLHQAIVGLGLEAEVRIAEMNEKERQAFLAMEQESWKGLP